MQSILLCLYVFTFSPSIGALVFTISMHLSRCSWRIDMGNAFQTTEKTHLLLARSLSGILLSVKFGWLIFKARVDIQFCEFFGKVRDLTLCYSHSQAYPAYFLITLGYDLDGSRMAILRTKLLGTSVARTSKQNHQYFLVLRSLFSDDMFAI